MEVQRVSDPVDPADGEERRQAVRSLLETAVGIPFTSHNGLLPLRNGVEIFPAMLGAIRAAERTIEFETFIYWSGDIARRVARALASATDRGVRVRVLLDAVGCVPMPADVAEILESSDARVRRFGRVKPWKFWRIDNRTHRKILVCDGRVGFTGGVGIAEQWEGDARNPDEWRDTHFRVEGPVVAGLRGGFFQHWLAAGGSLDGVAGQPAARAEAASGPRASGAGDRGGPGAHEADPAGAPAAAVQVSRSTGAGRWSDTATLFRSVLRGAEHRLRIVTSYFVPSDALVGLLRAASGRGVEVEVMTPGPHTDHRVCQFAGEETFQPLLDAGVKIWRYQPTMLHTKVVTVDGILSVIGSANFNHRSLLKDDELSLAVLDEGLTAALDEDFERDRGACEALVDPASWKERSALQQLGERASRLFRSEL